MCVVQERQEMSQKIQELRKIKVNIAQVVTLLDEAKSLADRTVESEKTLQTSLTFMIKSALDLNYHLLQCLSEINKQD